MFDFIKTLPFKIKFYIYNIGRGRGGRVVEGARLERVYAGNCIKGSNPFLSASYKLSKPKRWNNLLSLLGKKLLAVNSFSP